MTFWLPLVLAVAAALWAVRLYNRLVSDRNRVLAAWSDIDVQLKRRHDLVPKLVEAVRRYAAYEQAALRTVTELREQAMRSESVGERAAREGALDGGVQRLVALAESYPELKADRGFLELQQAISSVEDHLQHARRYYNGAVRMLNTRIDTFPDTLLARSFRFRPADYFDPGP